MNEKVRIATNRGNIGRGRKCGKSGKIKKRNDEDKNSNNGGGDVLVPGGTGADCRQWSIGNGNFSTPFI